MQQTWGDRMVAGQSVDLSPLVRRVLAPNPSPLTGPGTNSYLLGHGEVTLIDPGPDDPNHLRALLAALRPGEQITRILLTHAHRDHSALVPALQQATGAPSFAFGTVASGANPAWATLAGLGGGEGRDEAFTPDHLLRDGDVLPGPDWQLEVLHTPGHLGGHLSFALGEAIFSGDQAMGWATSIVSPPDGDMSDYMRSLDRLIAAAPARLWPGHGEEVSPALPRLHELRDHRRAREAQVLTALTEAPGTAAELAARIYTEIPSALLPAAARNVLAHLLDLEVRGAITARPATSADAIWHAVPS